jgi:hypothetical protein
MKMTTNNEHKARVKTREAVHMGGIVKCNRKLQKDEFIVYCEIEVIGNAKVEFWSEWSCMVVVLLARFSIKQSDRMTYWKHLK